MTNTCSSQLYTCVVVLRLIQTYHGSPWPSPKSPALFPNRYSKTLLRSAHTCSLVRSCSIIQSSTASASHHTRHKHNFAAIMAALPKRIVKETERLMAEPHVSQAHFSVPGISAIPHEENLRYFDVKIHGPSQSPYEGQSGHSLGRRINAVVNTFQRASSNLSSFYLTTIP